MALPSSFRSATAFLRGLQLTTLLASLVALVGVTASCGSAGPSSDGAQKFHGNTSVSVLLSSTANDQLAELGLVIQGISLTNQAGGSVSLLSTPQGAEFMTVNGSALPLVTTSIPQDIYTAVTATIGSAQFTCVTLSPPGSDNAGGLAISTFAYGQTPASSVTVNLPSPVAITGASMGLLFDMPLSQSVAYSSCYPAGTYAITPTFNVTTLTFSAAPTNFRNGKVDGLQGEITAIGASGDSFRLTLPVVDLTCPCSQPAPLAISSNSNTVYEGVNGFSALGVGTLVDMDGAMQPDGSVLATRIAVYDPTAINVMTGPLLFLDSAVPAFYSLGRQQQGQDFSVQAQSLGIYSFAGSTSFQVSGALSNVGSLPFVAGFDGSNMVPGQNIAVFSQHPFDSSSHTTMATTMTLMPQTLNGTIVGTSTSGNFAVYSVQLASYDLFPTLATQPGQTTLLNNPNEVEVYIDNNTQLLNTTALALGSTLRFNGLLFNDQGALRMDCAQVSDGVTATQSASQKRSMESGEAQSIHRGTAGRIHPTISMVRRFDRVQP